MALSLVTFVARASQKSSRRSCRASLLALPLSLVVLAACDGETMAPRGTAYPDVVGYDTPEQTPVGATAPSRLPPQQAQAQQLGEPVSDGYPTSDETAVGGEGESYADTDPSAVTDFRAALEPYGSWVDDSTYGTVWMPSESVVGPDFTPYMSAGSWSYGDDYVWMSDYSWGWAPFHYGRWTYLSGQNGWGWIPGRQYAGAWVTWRAGYEGYVGWAPMPPTYGWHGNTAVGIGVVPPAAYNFVATRDLFAPSLVGHGVSGPDVATIAAHTQPYVGANPGVRALAHPSPSGPPPTSMLHIAASDVARPPVNDRGLLRAQQFARPATAQLAGAHVPAGFTGGHATATFSRSLPGGAVAGHALLPRGGTMMPAYGGRGEQRFGTTRIGEGQAGYYGSRAIGGERGGAAYYGGGQSFRGGPGFSGAARGPVGAAPQGSHYYPTSGGYTGATGGAHYSGGHGGGHGGGGRR
jgi:hypothetical protein